MKEELLKKYRYKTELHSYSHPVRSYKSAWRVIKLSRRIETFVPVLFLHGVKSKRHGFSVLFQNVTIGGTPYEKKSDQSTDKRK